MYFTERIILFKSICITLLLCSACSIQPVKREGPDSYGCIPPPASTFATIGGDISIAQSTIEKVVTGDIKIKTQPEVISLLSQSAVDQELRTYLQCLAINQNHYTQEQAAYLESMALFFATNPTPEQFQKWQDSHPFPKKNSNENISSHYGISSDMYTKLLEITDGQRYTIDALISTLGEKDKTIKERDEEIKQLSVEYAELKALIEERNRNVNLSKQEKEKLYFAKERLDAGDLSGARDLIPPARPIISFE